MRRAALVLLLVLLLAPLARADHVYSHRYIVLGRVLDAQGAPVANVRVALGFENMTPEGGCNDQPGTETEAYGKTQTRPTTNALGEFTFCVHTHVITPMHHAEGLLRVADAEGRALVEVRFPLDPDFRISYVLARLPDASPGADAHALDAVATLAGRAWRFGPTLVEAVPVNGTTVNRAPVNITFHHDGMDETIRTTTNNYGDFAWRANVTSPVRDGSVDVEILGRSYHGAYDAADGISYLKLNLSAEPGALNNSVVGEPTAASAPAATTTPKTTPGAELALGLAAIALLARAYTRGGA